MSDANSDFPSQSEPSGRLSARNLEALGHLQRALELTEGFALFFADCDQPALRDDLIAHLEERLARQDRYTRRLDVVPPAAGLLTDLQAACWHAPDQKAPACIHVCGLEDVGLGQSRKALPPGVTRSPLLRQLNLARDNLRDLPCPLVFWLPDAALTHLARGAPDFWAWRSGTFDFVPQWGYSIRSVETPAWTHTEERIRALENLLADYRTLPDGPTEQRARAGLLVDLAELYRVTYRPRDARKRLDEALPLVRGLKDTTLESRTRDVIRNLGEDLKL